jgi:NAD+ kinase
MKIGIIPNTSKAEVADVLRNLIKLFAENEIDYCVDEAAKRCAEKHNIEIEQKKFFSVTALADICDLLVSIGGDGTMLKSAYAARHSQTPMLGINLGKLGFLAELEQTKLDELVDAIKNKNYKIEERIALSGKTNSGQHNELYAINDIVIDRGRWPKMIKLSLKINGETVSTFSADGIIIATPTGSTGYSLSTGGPIVTPSSDAVTISPISPHTLNIRPLVISSDEKIEVIAESPSKLQISADGQRVHYYDSPLSVKIEKTERNIKLFHTASFSYFELLRHKLYWGIDLREKPEEL